MLMRVQPSGSTDLRLRELLPLTVKDEKDAKARDLKRQLIPKNLPVSKQFAADKCLAAIGDVPFCSNVNNGS